MDLYNSMRAVVEVARHGNFTAAGRSMGLSSTSVSRLIGDLETDLGVRLFRRTTRQTAITDEGKVFLERCEAVLEEIDTMRDVTQSAHSDLTGTLVVSSALAFGTEMLSPVIPEFLERHPGLSVDLSVTSRTVDLIEEHVDVALRIGVGGLPDSSLVGVKLYDYRMIFVAHEQYVEAHGEPKSLGDFASHRMVKIATGNWGHTHELNTPDGTLDYPVPDTFTTNSYRSQLCAVLAGRGCALMHDFIAEPELRSGSLVRVLLDYETPSQSVYAVYADRTFVSARIRTFVDFLKDRLARHIEPNAMQQDALCE